MSLVLYTAPSAPAGQNAQAAAHRGLPVEVRTQGGLRHTGTWDSLFPAGSGIYSDRIRQTAAGIVTGLLINCLKKAGAKYVSG